MKTTISIFIKSSASSQLQMLSVALARFRLQGFPPAGQIPDSGDRKGGSEAGIEARKEFRGDSGDKLEGNSKPHHKKDEDIAPEVEKGEQRFLAFRKTEDAFCVTDDKSMEHRRKGDRHRNCNQRKPPYSFGAFRLHLQQGLYTGDQDFDSECKPAQDLHQQHVFTINRQYAVCVHINSQALFQKKSR